MTAEQVRAALLGRYTPDIKVERQAWRLMADDSDELLLLNARGSWWVARRAGADVSVWAYIGDDEADDGFEALVTATRNGIPWTEAAEGLLVAPDHE